MMDKGESKSRRWPLGIGIGLATVVVANSIMVVIALSHPSAPVSRDHWEESLEWDEELALRERSLNLGWSVRELHRTADDRVELQVIDGDGEPVVGLAGTLRLERADDPSRDLESTLVELGEGYYRSELSAPRTGLVRASVDFQSKTGAHYRVVWALDLELVDLGRVSA